MRTVIRKSAKEGTMSLENRLAKLRATSVKKYGTELRSILMGAIADLRASGILDRAIKVGDLLPPFVLENSEGIEVRSDDLLARGPIVLTVFRGHW